MEEGFEIEPGQSRENSVSGQKLAPPEKEGREERAEKNGRRKIPKQSGCVLQEANVRFPPDAESTHMDRERFRGPEAREVRVTKFGGVWRFQAKGADESDWTYYDQPLLDDMLKLKDVVFRKYQRRRASARRCAIDRKAAAPDDNE